MIISGLPPLNALRAFEAAARRGGFAAAAEELNVTPAAVGQQVHHLEDLLGVRLFERDGRGLRLTERGAAGLERLSRALNLMGEASAAMRDAPKESTLSIAASADFASTWLTPRLSRFASENEVAISVFSVDPFARVTSGEADLAIGFGAEIPSGLHAERLMSEVYTPAATSELAGLYKTAVDLDGVLLIHDTSQATGWQDWLASRGAFGVDTSKGIRVDNSLTAMRLAEQGAGLVLARRSIAAVEFRQNRLSPLFPDGDMSPQATYMIFSNPRTRLSPTASLFISWLRVEAAQFEDAADEL